MLALTVVALGACNTPGLDPATATANYQLVCDSSDTHDQSTLHCLRMDTRNGDVLRVAMDKLKVTRGSTAAREPSVAGTYQLECHATRTEAISNLYCVRLNTESGEMMLIGLPHIASIPE